MKCFNAAFRKLDDRIPPGGNEATLLATFQLNGTTPQPITTTPQPLMIAAGSASVPAVAVGTGRYLGVSDLTTTARQSLYVVKDTLDASGFGDVRASPSPTLVLQAAKATLDTTKPVSLTTGAVDWSTNIGWGVDLPNGGERITVDLLLQGSELLVASSAPSTDPCKPGGSSWSYQLNYATGAGTSVKLGDFLVVGQVVVLPAVLQTGKGGAGSDNTSTPGTGASTGSGTGSGSGSPTCVRYIRDQNGKIRSLPCITQPPPPPSMRRTSWRELVN